MAIQPEEVLALNLELETAIGLLKHGLAALESLGAANDFYHLPLLHLANGTERLCKCVLALDRQVRTGAFPTRAELRTAGHDVQELVKSVLLNCFPDDYLVVPSAVEDKDFLEGDPTIQAILECLANFGKGGRYYDLDVICSDSPEGEPSEYSWQRLESRIEKHRQTSPDPSRAETPSGSDYVTSRVKATIERFARSLCRLFTIGPLSSEGRRYSGILSSFLSLSDDDLGSTDYRRTAWKGPYG